MRSKQFFTTCKRCHRQILMTYCPDTMRWIPCDPELIRFCECDVPESYVTTEGIVKHGKPDANGEIGYRKHRKDCEA